jgi:hypothetical protein
VPAGFKVEVYANGVANARSMTRGSDGTVFVGTRLVGRVYAITEKDGKRTVKTIAEKLHRPNGVAFKDGALYVAELSRVLRYDDIEKKLDSPICSRPCAITRPAPGPETERRWPKSSFRSARTICGPLPITSLISNSPQSVPAASEKHVRRYVVA